MCLNASVCVLKRTLGCYRKEWGAKEEIFATFRKISLAIQVTEGNIGPFSSIKLQIIFTPAVPGDVQAEFEIVFDHPDCKPVSVVWVLTFF